MPAQLLIAGTARPGLALGGGFVLDHATPPSTDTDNQYSTIEPAVVATLTWH